MDHRNFESLWRLVFRGSTRLQGPPSRRCCALCQQTPRCLCYGKEAELSVPLLLFSFWCKECWLSFHVYRCRWLWLSLSLRHLCLSCTPCLCLCLCLALCLSGKYSASGFAHSMASRTRSSGFERDSMSRLCEALNSNISLLVLELDYVSEWQPDRVETALNALRKRNAVSHAVVEVVLAFSTSCARLGCCAYQGF